MGAGWAGAVQGKLLCNLIALPKCGDSWTLSWTVQCGVIFGVSRFDGPSLCFIAAFRSNYKPPQLSVPHSTASSFMKGEMWLRSALRPASWCLVTIAEWPQQIKMSRGFIFLSSYPVCGVIVSSQPLYITAPGEEIRLGEIINYFVMEEAVGAVGRPGTGNIHNSINNWEKW